MHSESIQTPWFFPHFHKLQAGCHVPFTEEWLPSVHSTIKAWLVECCRDGCLYGRFSHLHRGTLELCQSGHQVLGHFPDQTLFHWSLSLARWPALGRVLGVPNLFHLRMMEATVFLGTFNAVDIFWYPSPDLCLDTILSRSSTDSSFNLLAWFLLWHALSNQIKSNYICHMHQIHRCSPYCEMLTYKPLFNNAVQ